MAATGRSAVLHLRRSDAAAMTWAFTGAALVLWIVVEVAMLRSLQAIQAALLALGVAIVVISARSIRATFARPSGAERELSAHR